MMTDDEVTSITSHSCEWAEEMPFMDAQLLAASLLWVHGIATEILLWCGSNLTTVLWSPGSALAPNSQVPGHTIKIKVFLVKWF